MKKYIKIFLPDLIPLESEWKETKFHLNASGMIGCSTLSANYFSYRHKINFLAHRNYLLYILSFNLPIKGTEQGC